MLSHHFCNVLPCHHFHSCCRRRHHHYLAPHLLHQNPTSKSLLTNQGQESTEIPRTPTNLVWHSDVLRGARRHQQAIASYTSFGSIFRTPQRHQQKAASFSQSSNGDKDKVPHSEFYEQIFMILTLLLLPRKRRLLGRVCRWGGGVSQPRRQERLTRKLH